MYLSQLKALENDEIIPVISKGSLFGGVVFQQGSMLVQTCSIYKIELGAGRVILRIRPGHQLDTSHSLCINFAFRNFTFTVRPQEFELYEDKIVCSIPQEAKAIPQRPGGERHVLPFDVNITANLHRIEKRDSFCSFVVKIVDVSKFGLGAYIVGEPEGDLLQHDHIRVEEINGRKLEDPIFCRVQYVSQHRYKDDIVMSRIGLSLDKQMPEEVYFDLVRLCRLVLSA